MCHNESPGRLRVPVRIRSFRPRLTYNKRRGWLVEGNALAFQPWMGGFWCLQILHQHDEIQPNSSCRGRVWEEVTTVESEVQMVLIYDRGTTLSL
jgi:hypothetical protein